MMILNKSEKVIQVPLLKKWPFIVHGLGTRYFTKESLDNISVYKKFKKIYLDQKHSDIIHCIDRRFCEGLKGDSMITDIPDTLLVIKTADCLPVLLADIDNKVIGAVHCGWRGSGLKILQKAFLAMKEKYSTQPSSLMAVMGPCICGKCYEVGEDVYNFFKEMNIPLDVFKSHPDSEKKYFLDLRKTNQLQLQEIGLEKDKILNVGNCTYSDKMFLSYRRDGKNNARMLSFIGLSF
jgi:YfiH family protein